MILRFLRERTIQDPVFGNLSKKWRLWRGAVQSPIFPQYTIDTVIQAKNEGEFELLRAHFNSLNANAKDIRRQIAEQAIETFAMYRDEEGDCLSYPDLSKPEDISQLIKPTTWLFACGEHDFRSRVIIDFGWPNPHDLVAYLKDTNLHQLDVDG